MIPHEIEVFRAETLDDLLHAWQAASGAGRTPAYLGGGSELLTLARDNRSSVDAMIDYKRVAEAGMLATDALPELAAVAGAPQRVFGAALRLNTIVDTPGSGLFGCCAGGVADRSVRNTITLGGNICGMLAYREAVLPFLLLDGHVLSIGPETGGLRAEPLATLFRKRLLLSTGAVAIAFSVGEDELAGLGLLQSASAGGGQSAQAPDPGYGGLTASGRGSRGGWFYRRRTRDPRLDYPLVTLAMARLDGRYRVAISGAWGYPVRAELLEAALNAGPAGVGGDPAALHELCSAAVDAQGLRFRDDMRGSAAYRRALTVQALEDGVRTLEETQT